MWDSLTCCGIRGLCLRPVTSLILVASPSLLFPRFRPLTLMENRQNPTTGNPYFTASRGEGGRRRRGLEVKDNEERSRGRGRRYGGGSGSSGKDKIDALGRLLTRILRHMAVELKLDMRSDGYVKVQDLLKLNLKTFANIPLQSHDIADVREAVRRDNKQRFSLLEESGELLIRSNQGHTIEAQFKFISYTFIESRNLFFEKDYKDSFLWNAIIKSFSHGDEPEYAFNVFALMLVSGILVDEYSFSLVLKSCTRLGLSNKGMQIHGLMSKFDFTSDVFLQNCLICMYVKCGCIHFGKKVFDKMLIRDSFTYNLMIDGYVKHGMVILARELFDLMPMEMKNLISWNTMISGYVKSEDGFDFAWELFNKMPAKDLVSWNLMIDCCAKNGRMETACTLFERMPTRDVVTWASMVDGYARMGKIEDARNFFDDMPRRDVISCNAMMVGYVNNGCCMEAMNVFHDMLNVTGCYLAPDSVTLLTALSATAQLGNVDEGIRIHNYMEEHGFVTSGRLGVALIDMYAKCGCIEQALDIFEGVIQEKNVDHWNAMIGGLAIHGMGDLAFDLFIEMERLSIKPDEITFITILNACGHSGMVKEGIICFEAMRKLHNIVPNLQHYGCLVDILSRAGHVEEAIRIIKHMPIKPNDVIWRTLLSACNNQENLELGVPIAQHLIGIDSYNSSSYILLSNMYAQSGLWDYVRRVRNMMKERNVNKIPGSSWIEFDGTMHEFFAGSTNLCQIKEICLLFGGLPQTISAGNESAWS